MIRARSRCRTVVAAAALASSVMGVSPAEVFAAPSAAKRDPDDAKLRAGIALFEARNFTRAVAEFERAHATTKRPRALFWIARANEESNHRAIALRAYEGYLREASSEAIARDGTEVMGRIQMLALQLGLVNVSAPAGATIAIDNTPVGTAPLSGPIYVEPGTHSVTADGNDEQTIDLEPEGHADLQFTAHERKAAVVPKAPVIVLGTAAPAPTPAAEAKPATSSSSTLTIGGLAVSGLLAATSVYFAIESAGTGSDFARRKGELGTSNAELEELQGQTRLQTGVAVGTGVAAIAAAGLTLFVFRKSSPTETRVGLTSGGLDLSGRF